MMNVSQWFNNRMPSLIRWLCLSALLAAFTAPNVMAEEAIKTLTWDDLMPPGSDPENIVEQYRQKYPIDELPDDHPTIVELMEKLKQIQRNAPLNEALNGVQVKMPGYVVPLETDGKKSTEFLLVPYFGACIHVPPPPANQTVLVRTKDKAGAEVRQLYEVVWVTGTIKTERFNAGIADAGYIISATKVEPY